MFQKLLIGLASLLLVKAWGSDYVGALYTLDNNPDDNAVIISAIDSTGNITFASLQSTGGQGPEVGTTDLIEGQDGILVAGQYLFAINSGSNSVSMFVIDQYDPTNIVQLGNATYSGGDFPQSISVNPSYSLACVLNSGKTNGAQFFSIGLNGLVPIQNGFFSFGINGTSPPAGFTSVPGDTIFSADGSQAYVTVKGDGKPGGFTGFVWAFNIDGYNVTKAGEYVPQGATPLAFSLTRFPDSPAVLMTNPGGGGVDVFEFSSNGTLEYSANFTISGSAAACWSEYSNTTQSFWVADTGLSTLFELSGSTQNITVDASYNFPSQRNASTGASLANIAIVEYSLSTSYLYVVGEADQTIRALYLTPEGATVMQAFDLGQAANSTGQIAEAAAFQGLAAYVKPSWARSW